ncbi:hypothetical protein M9H77_29417 [Catharanthus roseus]|uniref:Uncharacterized protein n=1 Tax=Catharanthus roseus TaxID=4058 RepID=A0ACB9ZVE1_CATRO|nr:hypothetical protein M9H77_29417 [Catharanthus roseus]
MLGRCTLDLDPVDRGVAQDGITFNSASCSAVGLLSSSLSWYMHGLESSVVAAAPIYLCSLRLSGYSQTLQKKGCVLVPPCREACRYLTQP